MEKKVHIYTTPTCMYCKMAKEFFQEHNVRYEEHDVTTDEAARNSMIEKTGQMGVPVIEIDNEVVIGYDKDKLAGLLDLNV
ncbi:MAG: glutathione S-transferase N-terminal domain-containing protein [Candidatus Vogelbacteria bacterium]|nr:glutathione S-transferase N-terminal domain-containing protein [Candidatus Vogelbacteria bacterium]